MSSVEIFDFDYMKTAMEGKIACMTSTLYASSGSYSNIKCLHTESQLFDQIRKPINKMGLKEKNNNNKEKEKSSFFFLKKKKKKKKPLSVSLLLPLHILMKVAVAGGGRLPGAGDFAFPE